MASKPQDVQLMKIKGMNFGRRDFCQREKNTICLNLVVSCIQGI